jgi:hypothetical protein
LRPRPLFLIAPVCILLLGLVNNPPPPAPRFDVFLVNFHRLYSKYGHGPKFPKQWIDREAVKIWRGSGCDYRFASTTAAQGACETNYDSRYKDVGHRGYCGMRNNTCLVEAARLAGKKKWTKARKKHLLKFWAKNPWEADKLASSRLKYLTALNENEMGVALFEWARGGKWRKDTPEGRKAFKEALDYLGGVLRVRDEMFGTVKDLPKKAGTGDNLVL